MDDLTLFVDPAQGIVRGQLTFNPHRTRRDDDAASSSEIERRVLALVSESVRLEIDGARCDTKLEVRELWVPAGATLGDIVMLRCESARGARALRVFAAESVSALVVSVQRLGPGGEPLTQSVLLSGGSWSPPYRFDGSSRGWLEGGAARLATDASATPSTAGDAARSGSASASGEGPGGSLASALAVALRYLELGVRHILQGGWDHVAFVAALALGCSFQWRSLLWQLSMFTLAHSVTLALGALGWVVLPGRVVEPLIALSIVCVACANLLARRSEQRFRVALAFGFGLLHGQGFASALAQVGLPRNAFMTALVGFNLGVELGQLVVVFVLFALLYRFREPESFRRYAVRPLSIAIALIGAYWSIMRLRG